MPKRNFDTLFSATVVLAQTQVNDFYQYDSSIISFSIRFGKVIPGQTN